MFDDSQIGWLAESGLESGPIGAVEKVWLRTLPDAKTPAEQCKYSFIGYVPSPWEQVVTVPSPSSSCRQAPSRFGATYGVNVAPLPGSHMQICVILNWLRFAAWHAHGY